MQTLPTHLSETTARELLAVVPNPFFILDREWRFTYVNAPAATLLQADDLLGDVIFDRFPGVADSPWQACYRTALAEGRVATATGFYPPLQRWFAIQAVPHRGGLSVHFHDVTELKAAERREADLAAGRDVLRRVATAVAAGAQSDALYELLCTEVAALVDADGCWALRFTDVGSLAVGAVSRLPADGSFGVGDEAPLLPGGQLAELLRTGEARVGEPTGRLAALGLASSVAVPVRLYGRLWGAIVVGWRAVDGPAEQVLPLLTDLADLVAVALGNVEAGAAVERQAATDALTGLTNRRWYEQRLEEVISRSRRHGHPVTLALVGLDELTAVNDAFGHEAGDLLLQLVGGELAAGGRAEDLCARVGGDVFALVLDGSDAASALVVAERVRARVAALHHPETPPVTASVGLCEWGPGLSRAQLHAAADAALQWAKRHGGDAARVHDAATMGAATAERGRDAPVRGAGVGDPLALQERLRNARAFWRSTLDALPSHVAVLDARGEVLAANTAWSAWAQAGTSCVRPAPGQDYLTALEATGAPADARLAAGLRAIVAGGSDRFELEYACETPAGPRWFVVRANRFPAERPLRVVVHHADVTEARSARDLLVQQGQLLHKVPAAVVATDLDGAVTQWSDGAEALYGFHRDEALGRRIAELLPAVEPERGTGVRAEDAAGGGWEGELHLRDKRGIVRPVHVESTALVGDDGTPVGSVSVSVDLTGRDAHERDIEAARDYLLAVTSSMADGLLTCDREGRITYANAAAAELLGTSPEALFGRALREAVYPGGTGAAGVPAIDVPEGTARADDDRFATADGTPLAVSWTSTELPDVGSGPGRLVTFADATARRVREARLRHEADALRWAARIRTALEEDQFVLFAQPIVASATGLTTGHELLIRLRDGRGGFVPPAEFLPAAEEHGLMTDIDAWVLEHAVEIAGRGEHVHVNLSAQSVGDPSVITRLRAALERTGADPARVTLELTETALFTNADAAVGFAAELRGLGCGLALDDFGTGWNSLTRIQRIPVDELKIDMRFVRELLTHATSESVVKAIVSLAADLDVTTVAEGVEDPATAAKLRALGVTHLQGHHFGRPAPIAAVPVPAARGVLPPGLSVRAQQEGDVTVLALRGELDVETARQVRRAVSTARGTASRVVLDLADLEFVDSTGLGLLLELPRSAAAEDWQVAYRRPSRAVESVLAVAGIAALLPWADGDAPPA